MIFLRHEIFLRSSYEISKMWALVPRQQALRWHKPVGKLLAAEARSYLSNHTASLPLHENQIILHANRSLHVYQLAHSQQLAQHYSQVI